MVREFYDELIFRFLARFSSFLMMICFDARYSTNIIYGFLRIILYRFYVGLIFFMHNNPIQNFETSKISLLFLVRLGSISGKLWNIKNLVSILVRLVSAEQRNRLFESHCYAQLRLSHDSQESSFVDSRATFFGSLWCHEHVPCTCHARAPLSLSCFVSVCVERLV